MTKKIQLIVQHRLIWTPPVCSRKSTFDYYITCNEHITCSASFKYLFPTLPIAQQYNFKTTDILLGGFSNKLACLPVLPLATWIMLDVTFSNVFEFWLLDTTIMYQSRISPDCPRNFFPSTVNDGFRLSLVRLVLLELLQFLEFHSFSQFISHINKAHRKKSLFFVFNGCERLHWSFP